MTSKYSSVLSGARVLVIGGTSGIGFGVAEHALVQGAIVTISSSQQPKLDGAIERLQATVPEAADNINGFTCDLSNIKNIRPNLEALLSSVTKASSKLLDHIVFTAGDALQIKPVGEMSVDQVQQMGNVRFYAPMLLGGMAAQYMNQSNKSSLTLTSGATLHRPMKGWTAMCGYGAGLEGLANGFAIDLAPIRSNVVSPGAVETELLDSVSEEAKKAFRGQSLTDSIGTPEELSEAYIFYMRCSFVTGTVLQVEGGRIIKA